MSSVGHIPRRSLLGVSHPQFERVDVEAEGLNVKMVLLADGIPSSVANVFSPPFFAATDFVVADIEEPREATQDDGDIETENGKNEFAELGDDVGIIPQNAIPTFFKGRKDFLRIQILKKQFIRKESHRGNNRHWSAGQRQKASSSWGRFFA